MIDCVEDVALNVVGLLHFQYVESVVEIQDSRNFVVLSMSELLEVGMCGTVALSR